MTKYLGVILLTIFLLFVPKSSLAQGVSPSTDAAKQDARVELKFDESENVTTANLKPILLSGADPNKLQLEAFAFFRGPDSYGRTITHQYFYWFRLKKGMVRDQSGFGVCVGYEAIVTGPNEARSARLYKDTTFWTRLSLLG
jgi:hypothetical protein